MMVVPVTEPVEGTSLDVVSTSSTTGVMVIPVPEPVEGTSLDVVSTYFDRLSTGAQPPG